MSTPEEDLVQAVQQNDLEGATRAIALNPQLKSRLNDALPGLPFGATVMQPAVRWQNRELIALLQMSGADINAKTHWWAGGFTVLDFAEPDFVQFLIDRGAKMTIHAATRLGLVDEVRRIIRANKNAVNARGGDGQTPLHYAPTAEIAELLLDSGADIDAKDVDHESTAAQYRVREHPDVARFLVSRGAKADIFLAAALGDVDRVRAILDEDPSAVHAIVDEKHFPMKNRRAGGHMYIWSLGKYKTPHAVAREFGHDDVFDLLMSKSPAALAAAVSARAGDEEQARTLLASNPNLIGALSDTERRALPDAAQDNDLDGVRVLLAVGWPVDARGQHGGTALHWAGFHGNVEMARAILEHGPDLEAIDDDQHATPLSWTLYGSLNGWHRERGDYAGTVTAMLDAGAKMPAEYVASDAVRAALGAR